MKRNDNQNNNEHSLPLLDKDVEKGEEEVIKMYKEYMSHLNELERKMMAMEELTEREMQVVYEELEEVLGSEGEVDKRKMELMVRCMENKVREFKYNWDKRKGKSCRVEEWVGKMEGCLGKGKGIRKGSNKKLGRIGNSIYELLGDKSNVAGIVCVITVVLLFMYFNMF